MPGQECEPKACPISSAGSHFPETVEGNAIFESAPGGKVRGLQPRSNDLRTRKTLISLKTECAIEGQSLPSRGRGLKLGRSDRMSNRT